ncbi:MAG: hypothetical protein GWM98_27315, partial [Nitrospinaceae bacterium]|nr:hypothetical protein [Nitrospinaceae bacterium]NIR57486.1 hypothetical protein [Nitrospinaceae bacterium]NIS87956.1 hypothetical protein [Nitrospinaceae bacterium]NIT84821.1 hypothetical protein [Nitrospinaceae bacterium]NIU47001.1 hypothetical protein [Nitrospinaceae bacterium]
MQGTDGIRGDTRAASTPEFRGLSPQRVFLEHGFLTDAFMELYAYAHVSTLLKKGEIRPRDGIAVGWDPRDVGGRFNEAVVRGVRRAGADAWVLGIVPTPLIPLYLQYKNAGGGFMVTASHNPKDQNGIKTFLAFRGLKLLPDNDAELTRTLLALDFKRLVKRPLRGKRLDRRREARSFFLRFSLDPENSWIEPDQTFDDITLVVDPAHGSLSGLA